MWLKTNTPALGDFEQLVLLGVLRLELEEISMQQYAEQQRLAAESH